MPYYEVFVADGRYYGEKALTYSSDKPLPIGSVVSIPLRQRTVSGFVVKKVNKPDFDTKAIKNLLSQRPLPEHILPFARWLQAYYGASFGECLRQFAPSRPIVRNKVPIDDLEAADEALQASLQAPLTADQTKALVAIAKTTSTTVLLHGDTGTGKTRVYLEMAQNVLDSGRSVIILTPEIALTSQLAHVVERQLARPVHVLHSSLSDTQRKRIWLAILEAEEPVVIIGPRSALFSPVHKLGLIVVDEAHEPAYKQEQAPRYHAVRAASHLGGLTSAKVVLGTATPSLSDYHLAAQHQAVVRMTQLAIGSGRQRPRCEIVDLKDKAQLSNNYYLSKKLIDEIKSTLSAKQQTIIYLNRRGSARVIMCKNCGWQLLCPHCDIPLVYHADKHTTVCHTCGHQQAPPTKCPQCANPDIVYKSAGTKALAADLAKLFPEARLQRFDSDNDPAERLHELYPQLRNGKIDILVGTQLLAKGLDLPKLSLVGVIAAETSLGLPDYTAEERSFQLLYQVIGRVGRGHNPGRVVIQTYDPSSVVVTAAVKRDYGLFYEHVLAERRIFRFPPFSYLLRLSCRRLSAKGAETAADKLKQRLTEAGRPVEIIGPTPSFYGRRGRYFYWQLVVKAKRREHLVELAKLAPADWAVDLDPVDLL